MRKKLFLVVGFALFCSTAFAQKSHAEYVGRYTDGQDYVVYFEETPYGMTVRPGLWTATQLLKQTATDEFTVVDRTERGATFYRDSRGAVTGVGIRGMEGEGLSLARAGKSRLPIELLLSGKGAEAARQYLEQSPNDPARIISSAERVLTRFPSKVAAVAAFLATARRHFSRNAALNRLLGDALVAVGNRREALNNFRRAYDLDPTNKEAISGLARLGALPASEARKDTRAQLPFALASVFRLPTLAEIRAVQADWRARDLSAQGVAEVANGSIKFGEDEFRVRIVSHLVHRQKHYGAIIIPMNAAPASAPIIVEAKGVSWNYFHLNLERLDSASFMGDARRQFIYVAPSYRGEVLHFNGVDYQSEGDRTNAWDGATDDAIALLNVALKTTPEANANRICAFGRSRGGSVALLMGERDARIRCVVEWSGPADWFSLMGTEGWTQQEIFAEGLRTRAKPNETGGQLVEHFLSKAVRGDEDLPAVRRRMLAGSPLYFANRLPRVQMHYGMEDTSVPVRNGLRLAERLKFSARAASPRYPEEMSSAIRKSGAVFMQRGKSEAFFYPGQGHDTDRLLAPLLSRKFLIDELLGPGR